MQREYFRLAIAGNSTKYTRLFIKKCFLENRLVDSYDNLSTKEHEFLAFEKYQVPMFSRPYRENIVTSFHLISHPFIQQQLIGYNIDYTTLVFPSDYDKVNDSDCNIIRWTDEDDDDDTKNDKINKDNVTTYEYKFYKKQMGVVPSLLQNLLDQRNATKKLLKATKNNPFLQAVLDKRQLAYKLSANSVYGALGVNVGYLPNKICAMSCTAMGRESIKRSAEWVKKMLEDRLYMAILWIRIRLLSFVLLITM